MCTLAVNFANGPSQNDTIVLNIALPYKGMPTLVEDHGCHGNVSPCQQGMEL